MTTEPHLSDHWVHRHSATCWLVYDYLHARPRRVLASPCAGGEIECIDKERWMREWEPLRVWEQRGRPLISHAGAV